LRYPTKKLGAKEAEMKILGCDLHAKQQTIAMVDTETGEFTEKTLSHEGNEVRELIFLINDGLSATLPFMIYT